MRYRLPDGCAGIVHAGVIHEADADGTIELDAAAGAALAPHGLVPADEDAPRARPPRKARTDDRRMLR